MVKRPSLSGVPVPSNSLAEDIIIYSQRELGFVHHPRQGQVPHQSTLKRVLSYPSFGLQVPTGAVLVTGQFPRPERKAETVG